MGLEGRDWTDWGKVNAAELTKSIEPLSDAAGFQAEELFGVALYALLNCAGHFLGKNCIPLQCLLEIGGCLLEPVQLFLCRSCTPTCPCRLQSFHQQSTLLLSFFNSLLSKQLNPMNFSFLLLDFCSHGRPLPANLLQ